MAPDTDERAATVLVNTITTCHEMEKLLAAIDESGVAASARMENLPTEALANLCRASAAMATASRRVAMTGSLRTLDDACTMVLAKNPGSPPWCATCAKRER